MRVRLRILSALAGIVFLSAFVFGQTPTGSIEGNVTDPSSAVVAGATVTVTSAATGQSFTSTTNDQGFYSFRSLQPGVYSIKVEQQGFSAATAENIVVQVGQVARADVGLKVGAATETVQVEIGSTDLQVDTSRQTVDGVITGQQITALPLNERNFLDLASLQPGVTVVDGGVIDPTKVNAFRAVRVNGGSGTSTRVEFEGIDVTDETVGTTVANFSTDAVQEFNLSRSSFDLSTSLTTSGAVSVATRSGGNRFSGSGFYFKQDDKFDARPNFVAEKPEFNRDQVGYRFSGPFIKDRLFFFSNFERFNQADFSDFASARFPSFTAASSLPITIRNVLNRADYLFTDNVRAFYMHSFNDDSSTGGSIWSPFQNTNWTNVHVAGLNVAGGNLTHSVRFGYVNFNNRIQSQELSGFEFPRTASGSPFQVNIGPNFSVGPNSLAPQQTYQDNYQIKYDGSAVLGSHILRFGTSINRIILGGFANFAGPMTFNGDTASSTSTNPLDYEATNFFVGPNSGFFTARSSHNLPFGGKYNTRWAIYGGDQWKIRRNLTLNLGLRWNYDSNFFASKDVPRLPDIDVYGAGLGDAAKYPKNAFSPQVGFAWDVFGDGRTSVRGGFYLAYESNIFNNSLFDEFARITAGIGPTQLEAGLIVGPDGTPIVVNGTGCPPAEVAAGNYSCLLGQQIGTITPIVEQINAAVQAAYGNVSGYDPTSGPSEFRNTRGVTFGGQFPGDYKIPYSMQFNLGVQRELWRGHVLSVDFIRQRAVGLPIMMVDYEARRDARFFNRDEAAAAINAFLTDDCLGQSIDQAITIGCGPHPDVPGATLFPTIANFGLASDAIWTGKTVPDPNNPNSIANTRARLYSGGFSLYQALQVSLNGRIGSNLFDSLKIGDRSIFKGLSYTVGYALSSNKSTIGSNRPEFINNVTNNLDYNADFGPSGLDRTHNLTISANVDLIGGFRLDQIYRFATAAPVDLFIPNNLGGSGIFSSDLNGDGGIGGTPRGDLLPGTNIGAFGRSVGSIRELNQVLTAYNNEQAGRLTPHGQRLVDAGLFTEDQMRSLLGVKPFIPLADENGPNPFENLFTADFRLTRPIRIWKENWILEPSFSVFNVFNTSARNAYGALAIPNSDDTRLDRIDPNGVTNLGSINYLYTLEADRADLDEARGLRARRRQMQFGIRFSF